MDSQDGWALPLPPHQAPSKRVCGDHMRRPQSAGAVTTDIWPSRPPPPAEHPDKNTIYFRNDLWQHLHHRAGITRAGLMPSPKAGGLCGAMSRYGDVKSPTCNPRTEMAERMPISRISAGRAGAEEILLRRHRRRTSRGGAVLHGLKSSTSRARTRRSARSLLTRTASLRNEEFLRHQEKPNGDGTHVVLMHATCCWRGQKPLVSGRTPSPSFNNGAEGPKTFLPRYDRKSNYPMRPAHVGNPRIARRLAGPPAAPRVAFVRTKKTMGSGGFLVTFWPYKK